MPRVRVVTDTPADVPKAEARAQDIAVVPLNVTFGQETVLDGDLNPEEFWSRAVANHPQTSQPPVSSYTEVFDSLTADGSEVVCVAVTSKHSGTYNAACLAAQQFGDKVAVWDSLSISWGERFQAEAAVEAARQGKSKDEILALLHQDVGDRTHVFIVLDTIESLKKGGRAAKFMPVMEKVAQLFNIKLILLFKEGEIKLLGTANSFSRGLLRLEREVMALGALERCAVMHIRNPETADKFARSLADKLGISSSEIPIVETGAVLSAHGGPGVVAAVALAKRPETP